MCRILRLCLFGGLLLSLLVSFCLRPRDAFAAPYAMKRPGVARVFTKKTFVVKAHLEHPILAQGGFLNWQRSTNMQDPIPKSMQDPIPKNVPKPKPKPVRPPQNEDIKVGYQPGV